MIKLMACVAAVAWANMLGGYVWIMMVGNE